MSRRGWALFVAMSLIWGLPYLLIKVAVEDFSPVVVVFLRCAIGAALLVPWTLARGHLGTALRRHWRALLLFTVLEMTGPWLLLPYAEQALSAVEHGSRAVRSLGSLGGGTATLTGAATPGPSRARATA